jgi:hypothetical protein
VGTCYRLTQDAAPAEDDFRSNKDRGRRPLGREKWDNAEYRAVSVYSSPRDAADALRRFPQTGRFAARLLITRGAPITGKWAPTRHRSHWNLWGAPADLLACVREEGLTADQLDG